MLLHSDETNYPILSELIKLIKQKQPVRNIDQIIKFIPLYFSSVSKEELSSRDIIDLYGALISHWSFINQRQPGEVKLKVYNPDFVKEGWKSSHTIVEVCHDEMPFLVDTLLIELNRLGLNIHFIVHAGSIGVIRNADGFLENILDSSSTDSGAVREAEIYIEIDRQPEDEANFASIREALLRVLGDVALAVHDFMPMKQRIKEVTTKLQSNPPRHIETDDLKETVDFLNWLDNDYFTFLGYAEFSVVGKGEQRKLQRLEDKNLGILKPTSTYGKQGFSEELVESEEVLKAAQPLIITKSSYQATVHRPAYMDVIIVKQFDKEGEVIAESRFIGLYTSSAYHSNPSQIPLLRHKVSKILQHSKLPPKGHEWKALVSILESFPRDELFQISEDELYRTVIGILQIHERQRIRLFVRRDTFGRYFSCMVYVPRDLFNTELRVKMQNILMREFDGNESTFSPNFLESVLCRIDYIIRVDPSRPIEAYDIKSIESKLVEATRSWRDDLKDTLIESMGEHKGSLLYNKYARAFPAGYRETFLARSAVTDIELIENVLTTGQLGMCFYRMLEEPENCIRFKLFQRDTGLALTDVLPILENLGLRVMEEQPYQIKLSDGNSVWISDFGMQVVNTIASMSDISGIFQEAFSQIWGQQAENDGFNCLVMKAGMPWRDIIIIRSIAKYLTQIGFLYSQAYMENTLTNNPLIAQKLVELFKVRFNPGSDEASRSEQVNGLAAEIGTLLERVANLDSDRIIRRFIDVIQAILRTNYFQHNAEGQLKSYLSFKLKPSMIPDMPKPLPLIEVFVYSPRVEGVHLRGAKVARGGLRWSDRREDFRTEVLGLMKAQQVKNAVIVPLGAKGGFIPKCLPTEKGREAILEEAIECYKIFIRGLLDITDNLQKAQVVHPLEVVRFDEDDPYLVVAADKGTATFSDIANSVAAEYNFWLGDAFASGGSFGYDHKKMGITARGAWESVKRHFHHLGHDTQTQDFTVVGIGDMAGDVFGNGMLLSRHIKLVAAFNHMHIFIDPNPNPELSFEERQRLFKLPRSSWRDYNPELISEGGEIFDRSAKTIQLSEQARIMLGLEQSKMEPNELIRAILMAPVDLLWNGGIGTYVKATSEINMNVGDRANDAVRINGADLRCKVVGEGGNLGFTQLSRIEYALKGGQNYTDAIDNSAGVDCSDHEVNIKILLHDLMAQGELTLKQRNELLAQMQDEVGELVLQNNYHQTQAISNGVSRSGSLIMQTRLLHELEREGFLNRQLEFLPTDKTLKARQSSGKGLTKPEFAVLMAYSKTVIKRVLLDSDLPDEPYFAKFLQAEFPKVMYERFGEQMRSHYLGREIIVTQLTNALVQYSGISFVHRMYDEAGASPAMTARAFAIALEAFDIAALWANLEALDGKISTQAQTDMMDEIFRFMRRSCRWLLRNYRGGLNVPDVIKELKPKFDKLFKLTPQFLSEDEGHHRDKLIDKFVHAGSPRELAAQIVNFSYLSPAMDIIEASKRNSIPLEEVAEVYFELSRQLSMGWLRKELAKIRSNGYWEMLAGSGLKDDLDKLQRIFAVSVIQVTDPSLSVTERITIWAQSYVYLIRRWHIIIEDLKLAGNEDFVRYTAAVRCLSDLAQVCIHGGKDYIDIHM
ncbi:MAG: NAD-glutamate dehydrogenase [Gammaproteobacteria bacterium]|nr:NAD-glutamate dehydrogenase [Gammaproteobacteria bacterium]